MSITPPPGFGIYTRSYKPVGGTHECVNTFGFQNTIGSSGAVARAALDTLMTAAGRPYELALLSNLWQETGSYCLVNIGGILSSSALVSSNVGTLAINTPGPGTSLVVQKVTLNAGRQYRGRVAYPAGFIDETKVNSSGIVDAAVVSATTTKFESMRTATFASPYPTVLVHGPFGDPPQPGPNPTGIFAYRCTDLVGSQRRRLRGR